MAESLGFRAMTDVGQELNFEQMLSVDPRDAVVSVDPWSSAFVEAAEQVDFDLTIGRGVGAVVAPEQPN